jgi:hypothetical protein
MATATLSGTVVIIGTVTSIKISSIVFKKDNTVAHTISNNLPKSSVSLPAISVAIIVTL